MEGIGRALFPHLGRARVVGITGSPGTGKSTLSDRLIELLRARGERIGVVAVDPSSPFTGGALLGDRIRMQRHASDEEVFIRSLGTRGAHGGLSRATREIVQVLDAWGAATILVETVGVGQAEFDILGLADTVIVVVIPGMGDDVQANKAGILEIADVFALNKADREGAEAAHHELQAALSLGSVTAAVAARAHHGIAPVARSDLPPIVRTVATSGEGIDALLAAVDAHGRFLSETEEGRSRRRARRTSNAEHALSEAVTSAVLGSLGPRLRELAEAIADRALDPHAATAELLRELRLDSSAGHEASGQGTGM